MASRRGALAHGGNVSLFLASASIAAPSGHIIYLVSITYGATRASVLYSSLSDVLKSAIIVTVLITLAKDQLYITSIRIAEQEGRVVVRPWWRD